MGVNDHFDKMWGQPSPGAPPQEIRAQISELVLRCGEEPPDMPGIVLLLEKMRASDYFRGGTKIFHRRIGEVVQNACWNWDEPYLYKWGREALILALEQMYPAEVIRLPEAK